MAKTKFDMVGNIVEMSEKNDFGCQKDLHPRLRPTIGAKQGKKWKKKQKIVCKKIIWYTRVSKITHYIVF